MPTYKLTYFDIRGLAEPIRWMFQISGQTFEDERIPLDEWSEQKKRFSKHVGQLPILCIDDIVLTQVHACMRYIARRFGYNGTSEIEAARADEATELIYDLRLCCVAYKDSFQSNTPDVVRHTVFRDFANEKSIAKKALMRKDLLEIHFPKYFTKFAELLECAGGEWIAGSTLTYADLALANFFSVAEEMVNPDCLRDFPTLKKLKDDVFDIPQIQEWMVITKGIAVKAYGSGG
ncbi:glutathione S-transferase 3 [Folsomia candida]|uniref:Glutathione S-transferase 1 n=1 Tax=Folsomia candida TaxID=158441 RepID=A0A226ERV8_FOLCA|nr:glutathione S-transferase 3 [Folsomia candida]OXA60363.1 Glutathione S-transferase 1 [Folsomia candida]